MSTSDLELGLLRGAVLLCGCLCTASVALLVSRVAPVPAPSLGLRGVRRAAARTRAPVFAFFEPVLSKAAGLVHCVPAPRLRGAVEGRLVRSGDTFGLCADEWMVLGMLSAFAGALLGTFFVSVLGFAELTLPLLTFCGMVAPWMRLDANARERAKAIERSLPSAMDLCVLCMGAGADFPSALGFAAHELGLGHGTCREELLLVLDELTLGRTRVEALEALSARTGSSTVQQFVAAVCQSETKGTPLVDTLTLQSASLRQRRSVLAEEMAAWASVRMIFPLMLMVASVLLIIFAPFIVNGVGL